jgi:hypothetical protein
MRFRAARLNARRGTEPGGCSRWCRSLGGLFATANVVYREIVDFERVVIMVLAQHQGEDPAVLAFVRHAAALAALSQYRLQAMDNQAKTIQTKPASANAGD